jgi:hypothetical protein
MVSAGQSFAFGFRCDGGCKRPEIIALVPPAGWEALRTEQGEILHRCPGCRFDLIVGPLIRDLGWGRAA